MSIDKIITLGSGITEIRGIAQDCVEKSFFLRSRKFPFLWKISFATGKIEKVGGKYNSPIGITCTENADLFVVDRQPSNTKIELVLNQRKRFFLSKGLNYTESSICTSRSLVALVDGPLATLINFSTGEQYLFPSTFTLDVDYVAFNNQGTLLGMIHDAHTVLVWNVENPEKPLLSLNKRISKPILSLAFGLDDRTLTLGGPRGIVFELNLLSGSFVEILNTGLPAFISAMLWNVKSSQFLVADWLGNIIVFQNSNQSNEQ
jgi:WD40 repeat protein